MSKVLVVGELNVDIILNGIDGFPEMGKEKLAKEFTLTLGSSSAIFAGNLATLIGDVAFLGKIGDDNFGHFVQEALKARGVQTNHILKSATHQTGSTIVLNYEMDRAMVTYPGAMEQLSETEVSDEILRETQHLHVSSIFLQPLLKRDIVSLFKRAKKFGLTTSLDPQWDPAEKWELDLHHLLPYVDVFLPNRKELALLTGTDTVEEGIRVLSKSANILAIKDGERGALLFHEGEILRKPAFLNSQVADCIGAGDSFDAGFISKYIEKAPLDVCLEFANLTGAVNTTASGGTTAFGDLKQVEKVAKERFNYTF